jgi:hypothetical protein
MNIFKAGSVNITANTISLDEPDVNGFIDTNFLLTNRGYYRAMWSAILERARALDLEFEPAEGDQQMAYDHFLNGYHISELRYALSCAQDMQLYGKVLQEESPNAHSYLTEMLKAAALQGFAFRPVETGATS